MNMAKIDIIPAGEPFYQGFFDEFAEATVFCSSEGNIISANKSFYRLFGYQETDLIGFSLQEKIQPANGVRENPNEWSVDQELNGVLTRRQRADGSIINVRLSVVPVEDKKWGGNGKFITYRQSTDSLAGKNVALSQEEKYRSIFENAAEGIFISTREGKYLDANPALAKIYGFSDPEDMIEHFADIKHQLYVDPTRRDAFIRILKQEGQVTGFESRVRKKNGEIIWISENARAVCNVNGEVRYYEGTVMDISDRKWAEENLEIQTTFFSQLFVNSPQAIIVVDKQRNMMRCNKGFENLFGFRADDIIGYGMRAYIVPDGLMDECESIWKRIFDGEVIECETKRLHKDGTVIPVSLIGFPIHTDAKIHAVTYIYKDISERKNFEKQILYQAFHDSLTGLPNRSLFNERLERAIERSKRHPDTLFSVLLLDLNKFKAVNDCMGHPVGDRLLIEVGRRLSLSVRSMDTVARLGGDEFAVILEELASEEDIIQTAHRMENVLCEPFFIDEHELHPGVSIGILSNIRNYTSKDDVLRDVDIAMYRAKQQEKSLVVFDKRMHKEILDTISLEGELREAVIKEEFVLHYQPIVSMGDEQVRGFEALIRWHHAFRGIIPPDKFIPLAEETGLIVELGKWVVTEACRNLKKWQEQIPEAADLCVNVNVSIKQFTRTGLVQHIVEVLDTYGLSPSCLKVEITETVIMQDIQYTITELARLQELGVEVALDDFGTGYSSLSYLHRMPVNCLKIDRSFISDLEKVEGNLQIVQSIISLAKVLGLKAIAEGVENREQVEELVNLGCDYGQGFLFSRPIPGSDVVELIKNQRHLVTS